MHPRQRAPNLAREIFGQSHFPGKGRHLARGREKKAADWEPRRSPTNSASPLTTMMKVVPPVTALLSTEGRDAPFGRPRGCA